MARRLIGLDIGTNAVTVAEVRPGDPPRLDMFGQVALGRETMREGEVADDAAVTEAVGRLREEVGLKKGGRAPRAREPARGRPPDRDAADDARRARERAAVPGRASSSRSRSTTRCSTSRSSGPRARATAASRACTCCSPRCRKRRCCGSSPRSRPVACRSRRSTSFRSRSSVRSPAPCPISRSSARAPARADEPGGVALADRGPGAEGIVSFGGGVTAIAVHESRRAAFRPRARHRRPRAHRRDRDRARPSARDRGGAEASARRDRRTTSSSPGRARSIERPLSVLLDEVRSSIDYYRNQPGSSPLLRIVTTGGAAQLPGLTERLSALVGVPVEPARPRELVALGDIGFADEELPRLDPYLPGRGRPRARRRRCRHRHRPAAARAAQRGRSRGARRSHPERVAAAAAFVVLLGGVTFLAHQSVSSAKSQRADGRRSR